MGTCNRNEFKMVQECVDKYEVRELKNGTIEIYITTPKKFKNLWLIKLSEIIATKQEIDKYCDRGGRGINSGDIHDKYIKGKM